MKSVYESTDTNREIETHVRLKGEKTPYIHATVVPLTKDGRLSAKEYLFGHKEKLRGFQDRYVKAMEPFGLERGLKGSRSKHQTTS